MKTNIVVSGLLTNANDTVQATVASVQRAAIQLGTFTGVVTFEGTVDGSTWFPVAGVAIGTAWPGGAAVTAPVSGDNLHRFDVTELQAIRAKFTTKTTGTPTVKIHTAFANRRN